MVTDISRRKYKRTPLVEVVFELELEESQNDPTIWGRFYEKIKEDYPGKQKGERIALKQEEVNGVLSAQIIKTDAMRFVNSDESLLTQLSNDLLTVNALNGCYNGYESYRDSIIKILTAYNDVTETTSVEQLRLRYISQIVIGIDQSGIDLEEYFNYYPEVKDEILYNFQLQFQIKPFYNSHSANVVINSITHAEDKGMSFLVDINNVFRADNKMGIDTIITRLNEAHENIGRIFESVITEKTRGLFEEVKDEKCDW